MSVNGTTFNKRRVRAQDDARLYEKIFSDGRLYGCALTYLNKNLTIGSGYIMVKGRQIEIVSETVASDTTSADGYGRLKLVLDLSQTASGTTFTQYRWEWDYNATNSFPALTQDDINDGTHTEYELVVAIVKFTSSNISSVVSSMASASVLANTGLLVTGLSLPTSGYSGSGPYTIDITATGVTTEARKIYDIAPDLSATQATADLQQASWNLIINRSIPAANTLRLVLSKVPATACPFILYETVVS